ncbi:hypothetical protein FHX57_006817 [Paraburkholderia tropica]|uniref:hypothetical protein n=1 Tax=Paraburkholderia tropica TaxID=92647 RepID=UPI0016106DB0|nr:hypothetical protein [Paraburkholderia tropica]MBB3004435.1 hypothetical protein [Paraburkholderia tropica]
MSTREQFEAWFAEYHDDACTNFGGIDCTNPKGIAEDAWQASRAAAMEEGATTALSKLKALTTEMEGYAYFGSNPGVKEDDYEDVADAIRALAKAEGD